MNYSARKFAQLTGVTIKSAATLRAARAAHTAPECRRVSQVFVARPQRLEQILALTSLGLPLGHMSPLAKAPDVAAFRAQRARFAVARGRIDTAIAALDRIASADDPAAALRRFVMNTSWERWKQNVATLPRASAVRRIA